MDTQNLFKLKQYKFLLGLAIVLGITIIAKTGFEFGQWLKHLIN